MKIYAKQVSPDYQESPIFQDGCFPDNIAVIGNERFNEHVPEILEMVLNVLKSEEEATDIAECLPPVNGEYSIQEAHTLRTLIFRYWDGSSKEENETLCQILSIVAGKKWNYKVIRGSSQSDWQEIYYPVDEWDKESLSVFETEYFNEGTEWIVHDEETDPKCPDDVSGYSVYCTAWNEEDTRHEIAKLTGVNPEDVILYVFVGYRQTALYEEV